MTLTYEHRVITEWPGELRPISRRTRPTFRAPWAASKLGIKT